MKWIHVRFAVFIIAATGNIILYRVNRIDTNAFWITAILLITTLILAAEIADQKRNGT